LAARTHRWYSKNVKTSCRSHRRGGRNASWEFGARYLASFDPGEIGDRADHAF